MKGCMNEKKMHVRMKYLQSVYHPADLFGNVTFSSFCLCFLALTFLFNFQLTFLLVSKLE